MQMSQRIKVVTSVVEISGYSPMLLCLLDFDLLELNHIGAK